MPILGDPKFSRTLPLAMFERLQELLQQMKSKLGEGAVLLSEDVRFQEAKRSEPQNQRFTVLVSERFCALLLGEPQQPEPSTGHHTPSKFYQVGLTFESEAIANFLTQFSGDSSYPATVLNWVAQAQTYLGNLQTNEPALESEFTLSLLEIFASGGIKDSSWIDDPFSPQMAVCKPVVGKALRQQIEQERLLNQVTTQIRQSLELPVILETAVEQMRDFLKVDRLVIYQFDEFNYASAIDSEDTLLEEDLTESSKSNLAASVSPLNSTVRWGCVTYEARASSDISSVLNLIEEKDCLTQVPNCREKYHPGVTIAVDDIEIAYASSPCLLKLLRRIQVRAKLVVSIFVQDKLWGFLIAHECFNPRSWQESEQTFLNLIAEHLSVAIYQAQLYAQLQQQKTTLEQQVIERTQELRDTLQAAQAASRAKSEFLATMSHELRTPLTCIIGMSATLLRWSFGQEGTKRVPLHKQRGYLQTIQESGEHLLELINDILDLSQVEAGKAVLNISEFSLTKLVHQTIRTLQEKALVRRVTLELDFRVTTQAERFRADKRRVKQILFNLLGNAIKFTPPGGKVILRVWREQKLVIFQVEDTGIGIPDDQIPLLFQKFQQLETVYQRNYEGTGLGLALTKQLVELHGGTIEVESVVSEGSVFTVSLPNQPLVSAASLKQIATHQNHSNSHASLVLVEDQEESATLICEILTAAGYHVVWLIDGSTALQQIELLQPKAVIVDWQLRGIDGSEITHCLRNSPSTKHIKVLALTTSSLTEGQAEDLSIVVDHCLPKPIEPRRLLQQVKALMSD
ncbi:MAG TPA: ATP-binding protein [Waterburya sp.]|jgi:two-component system sensor histidine kinase/response regulator